MAENGVHLGHADGNRWRGDLDQGRRGRGGLHGRDFESPADADEDNDYEVTVKVEDADGNTATQALTVTVTDVVETATLTINTENAVYTSATPTVTRARRGDLDQGRDGRRRLHDQRDHRRIGHGGLATSTVRTRTTTMR